MSAPRVTAWFHCFAGIAGDMALGSLLDAGADLDEVRALLRRIPLADWDLEVEPVLRGGIACSKAVVSVRDDVVVRTHGHIVGLLAEAALPERVHRRAGAVFAALAEVEGRLHRRPADQVHFHEVGGHDAVVDIVGTAAALEVLGVDEVTASPVATGTGMVRSAHGLLPNPAPAVVGLLRGAPTYGRQTTVELTTPTGAAIVAALASSFGPLPPMEVASQGFGAGTNELDELPNCTQVVVGTTGGGTGRADTGDHGQPVVVIEANVDDASGEQLAEAVRALLAAGAHDAWLTPVVMKKGRPGYIVHALSDPVRAGALRQVLRDTTGTFGVRQVAAGRWPLARDIHKVEVCGSVVHIKVGPHRAKAEFDDVARVSAETGLALHEVTSRAEAAWRQAQGDRPAAGRAGPGPWPSDDRPA